MDGGNVHQTEFIAHPDLIDLDVGVGRDRVLQVADGGYQHTVDFWRSALNGFPVTDVHHLIEHAIEQDVPKLNLRLTCFHQPVRFGAPFCLIEKFVLGKGGGIDHAQRNRQWIKQRLGEIALNDHLLGGTPCSEQREAQHQKPSSESGRIKVENR